MSDMDVLDARDIAARTVRGSAFNIAASGITMVSGFARSVLLARLLTPEDFGVMALALILLSFAGQVSDFGFSQALIHRDTNIPKAASTHFTLRLSLSVVTAIIVIIISSILDRLSLSHPHLTQALLVLSFFHVISALNSTPQTILRKNLDFKFLAILDVITSLSMTFGAVTMALVGLGFWSLVGEQAIAVLIRSLGLWGFKRPWKPTFGLDKAITRWYFGFGSSVFFSSGLTKLLDQFDDFWTGTALGSIALGFYSRAYEFARYPRRVIAIPITKVFFPTYARLQQDRLRLSKAYYRASSLIVRMGFLFSLILVLVVPEFIRIFIGAKWLPIVPTFRLMIFYTLLDPLIVTSGHLLIAVGQPRVLTKIKALQLSIFVPAVIILAHYFGINGVAVAADLMLVTGIALILARVRRYVDFSLWKMFRYPTIGLLLGAGAALLVARYLPVASDFLSLVLKGGMASVIYGGLLLLLERNEYMRTFRTVYNLIRSGGHSPPQKVPSSPREAD
ncbi:MAG: lipopolysaccharide biosynthesis protein [Chloroflexota bacterium]|nr:lipopolysaccharide biosynthesis protein [Chloroflexota bacterium]